MIKISRMGDYAIVLLTGMGRIYDRDPDTSSTARSLSSETGLPQATVGKLLKALATANLLTSQQGRHGGYRLARQPARITLAEIIEAVDGPIAMTNCFREDQDCEMEDNCSIRPHWRVINDAIRQVLDATTLADLNAPVNQVPLWYTARPDTNSRPTASSKQKLETRSS